MLHSAPACGAIVDNKSNFVNLNKKRTALMLSGILAGIIIIVLILSALFGGGYKSAISNYFEGFEDADAGKIYEIHAKMSGRIS